MAHSIFIKFRGEDDVEVEYRYGGYEYDTNATNCEWWFVDDKFRDIVVTDEEEQAIFEACCEAGEEPDDYDW